MNDTETKEIYRRHLHDNSLILLYDAAITEICNLALHDAVPIFIELTKAGKLRSPMLERFRPEEEIEKTGKFLRVHV